MAAERQEAVIDGIIIPERTPIIQSLFLFEPIKEIVWMTLDVQRFSVEIMCM
jgi:hypothetical protein